jgi:acetyl esterase/lipase
VVYAVLAVSAYLWLSALTALRPGRKGMLKVLAFPVGWAAGELAAQALVAQAALLGLLALIGWPTSAGLSDAVICLAAVVALCNLLLIGTQLVAQSIVERSMAGAPRAPLAVGARGDDRFGTWWRTALQFPFHPRGLQISRGVTYGPLPRQRLDVWRMPTTPPGAPVFFFIHGGAWVIGDKDEQARPMLHELVSRGWVAVAPNYRLAPKYSWPAPYEDVTRALAWVRRTIGAYGGDPSRIVIGGASAGGQLASLVALVGENNPWRPTDLLGEASLSVSGCVSLYGVLEMSGDPVVWDGHGDKLRELLESRVVGLPVAGHEALYRSMSPIERITEDAPPFLVIQGGNDTLVDVTVAREFVRRFEVTATSPLYYVELPLTQHAFDLTASPRTSATTRAVVAFATSCVSRGREPARAAEQSQ